MKYNGKINVKRVEFLAEDAYKLIVDKPKGIEPEAGQFFMMKTENQFPLLNRPISIAKVGKDSLEFVIKIVGYETKKMSLLEKSDELYLLGPLGRGFEMKKVYKKVLLIGGGIGNAPLKEAARVLKENEIETSVLLGFRNEPYDLEDYRTVASEVISFSEKDVANTMKGYPTDLLEEKLHHGEYDAVFTCGPKVLMQKVQIICKKTSVESQLLLEEKMGCGIGACLGCTISTIHGFQKVCKDGPMFYGDEVIFDEIY